MAITYCNTTSDLTAAHRDIDRYKGDYELDSTKWAVDSGSRYKQERTGLVDAVYEDGVALTEAASQATVDASGEWYYDSTNDVLYIRCSDDGNPNTHEIEVGETWSTFKTTCRNDAQEMLEGFLREMFVIPFQKIISPKQSYNSKSYDYWIVRATALLTCYLIIKRLNVDDSVAEKLFKEVYNESPEPEENKGIVQMIKEGDVVLKIQKANREPGGFNVYEEDGITSTAFAEFSGYYLGNTKQIWRLQIDTAGTPGTATFKLSKDGGTNWDSTLQATRKSDSDARRISLGSGMWVEFTGTFGENDYWDIELFPASDMPTISQVESATLRR